MPKVFNRFVLCFFDVLGFRAKFKELGLSGMLDKYEQLIELINARNWHNERLFNEMGFNEGAYWSAEGDAFVFSKLHGAYGSDSLLIWAHADFPEARYPSALELPTEERLRRASDPANGWRYHTVPCDNFLDMCNELICKSIEIGLPLRGALSMGEGVFNIDRNIFLGQPLIDTATMEPLQRFIGASYLKPFMAQIVPKRYAVPFEGHLKTRKVPLFQGDVLDWPRHWRHTRKTDPRLFIQSLDTEPSASAYYENTLRMIAASEALAGFFETPTETTIRRVYPQFASPELALRARAVRRVPVDKPE